MKPIDIILPTFNRQRFLEIILPQLKKITYYPHRIIIVLNCIGDGQPKDPEDKTKEYLLEHKDLYDILIPLKENLKLSAALNLGMKYVESEDFIVTNDDILLYNDGWLADLYRVYKEGKWFSVTPFLVPDPRRYNEKKYPNYAPEDIVIECKYGFGINSLYRIQNTKKIRELGGFRAIFHGRQEREGRGLLRIKSKRDRMGQYLKIRTMHMDDRREQRYIRSKDEVGNEWDFKKKIFEHFMKTGEIKINDDLRSNNNLVKYSKL